MQNHKLDTYVEDLKAMTLQLLAIGDSIDNHFAEINNYIAEY